METIDHNITMRRWSPELVFTYRVQNVKPQNPRPLTGPEDRLELSREARGLRYRDRLVENAKEASLAISDRDRRLMEILEYLVETVTGREYEYRSPRLLQLSAEDRFNLAEEGPKVSPRAGGCGTTKG